MSSIMSNNKVLGLEMDFVMMFIRPVVIVIVFVVSFFLLILPKLREVSKIRSEAAVLNEKVKKVEAKRDYLLTVDEVELKNKASLFNRALLVKNDAYYVVEVIRQIANNSGFSVSSFLITPGEVEKEDEKKGTKRQVVVREVPVSATVVGPSSRYLEFIINLEKSLPILSLTSFDLTVNQGLVELDIRAQAFNLKTEGKIDALTLDIQDLVLADKEEEILSQLNDYNEVSVKSAVGVEEFVEYQRKNPFSL